MAIKIIDKTNDIYLTRAEYDKLHEEWELSQMFTTKTSSFEEYVAARRHLKEYTAKL